MNINTTPRVRYRDVSNAVSFCKPVTTETLKVILNLNLKKAQEYIILFYS